MKKILFLVFTLTLIIGKIYAQRTVKTYQPAYVINSETAKRIASEQQLNKKSVEIQLLLIDYPILEKIEEYNRRQKYSLINDSLILTVMDSDDGKYTLFYLKNNEIYKVKNKKRIN